MPHPTAAALALALALPAAAQAQDGNIVVPAAEIGARVVIGERARTDRRVVTPFSTARRLVVRPAGLPDAPATTRAAVPVASAPAPRTAPAAGAYIDIGPLDAAPAPEAAVLPKGEFVDTGPYRD